MLLNHSMLERYDKSNMHRVYDIWPDLARQHYGEDYGKADFKGIDHVVFAGMGGSGTIGDSLSAILSKTNMHVCVVKGFHLPKTADSSTLVIATSVSGNTSETQAVLESAKKARCKIIAFSSGGKIRDYCLRNKLDYRNIPMKNSPRASFPIYLYSILNVLDGIIPVKKKDVLESIRLLENTKKKIYSGNLTDNPALDMAKWISGIPMIYYPAGLQGAAIRFKNSLQENAKIHVIAEDVIEASHNGIVSWEKPSNVHPILIRGKDDYVKTKKLWKVIKQYFVENKIDYREIYSVKGNILSKIVNLVYLLDYASIYYAVTTKTDPTPIKSIQYVKDRMY